MATTEITAVPLREATKAQQAGHALAGVGQNLIWAFWNGFILIYFTDAFGLPPAFVGGLVFLARLVDLFVDPAIGFLADRTRTRWGRYRPFLLFAPLPLGLALAATFTVPALSGAAALVYATSAYILTGILFSCIEVPYWSLPVAMARTSDERTRIFATSRLAATLAMVVGGIALAPLLKAFGGGTANRGYAAVAVLVAVLAASLHWTGFSLVREHVVAPREKVRLRDAAEAVFRNGPFLLLTLAVFLNATSLGLRVYLLNHYAEYDLGDLALVSALTGVAVPGTLVGSLLAPRLCRRFAKRTLFLAGNVYIGLLGVALYFLGWGSLAAVLALFFLMSFRMGMQQVLNSSMLADTIDLAKARTGRSHVGVLTAASTYVGKVATAVAAALAGLALSAAGYVANAAQPEPVLRAIHTYVALVPALAALVSSVPMLFYRVDAQPAAAPDGAAPGGPAPASEGAAADRP